MCAPLLTSNNDLDLFGELHTAALIGKAVAKDASACNAFQVLEMATINGARALGIDNITGSIEPDKAADIIAININDLSTLPMHNLASTLVYNNRKTYVSHVWVNGKALLLSGHLQTLNELELKTRARAWQEKMSND